MDRVEANGLANLEVAFFLSTGWDEFWPFVGSKPNRRWTWYAIERCSCHILAYHNGRRTDEFLLALLRKVVHFPIKICHTDDWGAYERCMLLECRQVVGKDNTQKIERKNLNFRTHLKRLGRRTTCFSKSEEIHDKVIGIYLNRYYFNKHGKFSETIASA